MTSTELGYLSGVTSNIQDQLNGKAGVYSYQISSVTGGWKQILSWVNYGSFLVSISNNYNYQITNTITILVTTGYDDARIKLLNTASLRYYDANNAIQNIGINLIGRSINLNILLCDDFNNNLYIDVLPITQYIDPVLNYDPNPSIDSGLIEFTHNFTGTYTPVKSETAVYGDSLPATDTNKYESSWYKGQIFFLKST